MTYVRRKKFKRKPKDVLLLAIRNLGVKKGLEEYGEQLICTRRSYDAMGDRIKEITESLADRKFGIIRRGATWKIWRTA